jgi:short-subunit dehydrogenase
MKLNNKVGLVTGASQGIGRAIALRLAAEGMAVAVVARSGERLRALAKEIESQNGRCLDYPADLNGLTRTL